jgi:cold shock CspA family protein
MEWRRLREKKWVKYASAAKSRTAAKGTRRMTGKIERIVEAQGLGFITGDDGEAYVFHRSALAPSEPFGHQLDGAAVTFDIVHEPKGVRAEVVRIVSSEA